MPVNTCEGRLSKRQTIVHASSPQLISYDGASALQNEEMPEQDHRKGTPVGAQLDADVASIMIRIMFQGLALGGSSGRTVHPTSSPLYDLATALIA